MIYIYMITGIALRGNLYRVFDVTRPCYISVTSLQQAVLILVDTTATTLGVVGSTVGGHCLDRERDRLLLKVLLAFRLLH